MLTDRTIVNPLYFEKHFAAYVCVISIDCLSILKMMSFNFRFKIFPGESANLFYDVVTVIRWNISVLYVELNSTLYFIVNSFDLSYVIQLFHQWFRFAEKTPQNKLKISRGKSLHTKLYMKSRRFSFISNRIEYEILYSYSFNFDLPKEKPKTEQCQLHLIPLVEWNLNSPPFNQTYYFLFSFFHFIKYKMWNPIKCVALDSQILKGLNLRLIWYLIVTVNQTGFRLHWTAHLIWAVRQSAALELMYSGELSRNGIGINLTFGILWQI